MTTPIHTWIVNSDHSIALWIDADGMYCARCTCGWHTASATAGLRNWNVDGHARTVEAQS